MECLVSLIDERIGDVFSYVVNDFTLGNYPLKKPKDTTDLWVDFNCGSRSVSAIVEGVSGDYDWEIVTVGKKLIDSVSVETEAGLVRISLTTKIPASQLVHFCPTSDDRFVRIVSQGNDILQGVEKMFTGISYKEGIPVPKGGGLAKISKKLGMKLSIGAC